MTKINHDGIALLTQHLSADEKQQVQHLTQYLGEKARSPTGAMAEGSVASLLNQQSPRVRQAFARLNDLAETPRNRPFDQKLSEADHFGMLGLDPDSSTQIKAAIDGQYVASRLQDRLGTDAHNPDTSDLSQREILSAAYDAHTGEQ